MSSFSRRCRRGGRWLGIVTVAVACVAAAAGSVAADPSARGSAAVADRPSLGAPPSAFEERVDLQRRIERLRSAQRSRTGPGAPDAASPGAEVADASLVERVRDQLRLESALERVWGRDITAADLAAELERIVAHSNDRATLRALFAALDDDPAAIARGLAEPILVRRLAHRLYWWDPVLHGELRRRAEAELASVGADGIPAGLTGEVTRTEWRLNDGAQPGAVSFENGVQIRFLDASQWSELLAGLARRWRPRPGGGEADGDDDLDPRRLPRRAPGALMEAKEYFWASEVTDAGADFVRLTSFTWWKTPFGEWWEGARGSFSAAAPERDAAAGLALPAGWERAESGGSCSTASVGSFTGDAWYPVDTSDPDTPSPRDQHTAVWTGAEMIVWGGTNGTQYFKSGGVYDPATDSWTATPTTGDCPSARIGHGAVRSGSVMFVWGGWNGSSNFDTGAKYNPVTNAWTALPVDADTPIARHDHGMAGIDGGFWVWGGTTSISATSTGAEYSASQSRWIPSVGGAGTPAARAQATMVSDPSGHFAFIVWGGSGGGGFFGDGAAYHAGDAPGWDPLSATDAPSERFGHTAVWCLGSCCEYSMIVWGGFAPSDTSSYSSTGGVYQALGLDTWTATPSGTGLPSGRYDHTAVMDDSTSTMIVWGGSTGTGVTRSGGLLDLCGPSWQSTSTSDPDTPSARSGHTAVWTDDGMIVWGGSNGSTYYDDGGLYTYCSGTPGGSSTVTAGDEDPCAASGVRVTWTDGGISWYDLNISHTVSILRDEATVVSGLSPSAGSYLDTGATPGQTHTYKVVFNNSCGLTLTSDGHDAVDEASSAPTVTAEVTVADADACTASSGMDVSWPKDPGGGWGDNGAGTRRYRVWRWDSLTTSWGALGSQIGYGTTSYHDGTTLTGLQYRYRVRYINGCGDSAETAASDSVGDLLGASPGVSNAATAADAAFCSQTGIRVTWAADPASWGDHDEGDRYYRVQRSTDGTDFNPIGDNIAYPATSWVDTTAAPDTPYHYRVRYKNGCGLTGDSVADTATDAASGVAPTVTVNSVADDTNRCADEGILVTWEQDPAAWGDGDEGTRTYDVLRGGSALPAATGLAYGTTSFTDTTGVQGTGYAYQVRYTNGCGIASATSGQTAWDRPTPPSSPANNSTAEDLDQYSLTGVTVTWDADPDGTWGDGSGAASHTYEVLRDGVSLQSGIAYGTTELVDDTGEADRVYLYTVRYWNCGDLYSETAGASAADGGVLGGIFYDGFESGSTGQWSNGGT